MKKLMNLVCVFAVFAVLFSLGVLLADKESLREDIIRLHVVANSDSEEDQQQKLLVRDAVVAYLQPVVQKLSNKDEAKAYLLQQLQEVETTANNVLKQAGSQNSAKVSLTEETFGVRQYDTFSLPSGVYDSLRIQIGSGSGRNWWCVVFPSLCLTAAGEDFQDTAVSSGFNDALVNTLQKEEGYELRFFLLDCIGKIENFFFRG